MTGYWPAAWPAEDGGPRRLQAVVGARLDAADRQLVSTSRDALGATMVVQRGEGELYLQGATIGPDSTAWVECIHPETLAPIERIDTLPAGPWWPGGVLAHANGDLYVTQGRWCHRVSPTLDLLVSRQLPRDRPYNSLVALPDGRLVMKDMSSDNTAPSQLVVLDAETLSIVLTYDLPEGSIARLSATGSTVCVVGMDSLFALDVTTDGVNEVARVTYRVADGQTFGWDAVLTNSWAWFLDNGEGTESFAGSFLGQTSSTAPLHLVRTAWPPDPIRPAELFEICGEPGGIVANPPIITEQDGGGVAVGYDSGHGTMTAWRWSRDDPKLAKLWQRDQNHAAHSLFYPTSRELVAFDFDPERGIDQCVVLDIDTGIEQARVDTGSPIQSVVFPCPGWDRDFYLLSMTTLTRVQAT